MLPIAGGATACCCKDLHQKGGAVHVRVLSPYYLTFQHFNHERVIIG